MISNGLGNVITIKWLGSQMSLITIGQDQNDRPAPNLPCLNITHHQDNIISNLYRYVYL